MSVRRSEMTQALNRARRGITSRMGARRPLGGALRRWDERRSHDALRRRMIRVRLTREQNGERRYDERRWDWRDTGLASA